MGGWQLLDEGLSLYYLVPRNYGAVGDSALVVSDSALVATAFLAAAVAAVAVSSTDCY